MPLKAADKLLTDALHGRLQAVVRHVGLDGVRLEPAPPGAGKAIHLFDLRYNKNSLKNYVQQNGIDCAAALYSISNFVSSQDLFLLGMRIS